MSCALLRLLRHLLLALSLTALLTPVSVAQETPLGRVEQLDFRLLLAQMAQKVGANGQIPILQAQGPDPAPALVARGGEVRLEDVIGVDPTLARRDALGRFVLSRPLLVWPDARLVIAPGETLLMETDRGAFLTALGAIEITGAHIAATTSANGAEPQDNESFRPFVLVAGQGFIRATQTRFDDLGFGTVAPFSGVAVINRGIFPARAASVISGNRFARVGGVSLLSVEDARIRDNQITAARAIGISLRSSQRILIAGNHLIQGDSHGIRVAEGAHQIEVSGNRIEAPRRIGLLIDSRATEVSVTDNAILDAGSNGIGIEAAFCLHLGANTIRAAQGNGIKLRGSDRVVLRGNEVAHSRGAGLTIEAQPAEAQLLVEDNRFTRNRTGVRGSAPGLIEMRGNDFSNQFPRFLAGDLMQETAQIVADLHGARRVTLRGSHDLTRRIVVPDCTLPGGV